MEKFRFTMARIPHVIFALVFFFGQLSVAQVKNIEGQYGVNTQMPTNYVKNKGCYSSTRDIVASGGSLTRNTTTPLENGADCAIDASASGQTYTWSTFSFDRQTAGKNCEAQFTFKGDASLYKAYVNVNSVKVTTDLQLTNSGTNSQPVSINFPCGAQPLTTTVVIESTSASAAAINVSNVYAGLATNIGSIAQARNVVNFVWSSGGALTATHDTDILFTWSTATINKLENMTHSSGVFTVTVPGDYQVKFCPRLDHTPASAALMRAMIAKVYKNSSTTPLDASGYVHGLAQNNINGGGEPSTGFYANPPPCVVNTTTYAANDTIRFKAYQANGSGLNTYSWIGGTLEINYFPTSSQQAISTNKVPSYWYGTHGSDCAWTLTGITTFGTDYGGDATCTFASKTPNSGISCVSQTQSSNPSPGITCTFPKTGAYEVCATFVPYGSVATGHAHRLFDGTNTLAQMSEISNAEPGQVTLCGPYTATSLSAGFRIQSQAGSGNNILQSQRSPASAIEWSVKPLDDPSQAPVLIGSVTSTSVLPEYFITGGTTYAQCTSSPCSLFSGTNPSISSITRSATGTYAVNFVSGTFSQPPICTFSTIAFPGTASPGMTYHTTPSITAVYPQWYSGGVQVDVGFTVSCKGSR